MNSIFSIYSVIIISLYGVFLISSINKRGMFSVLNSFDIISFLNYNVDNDLYNGYFEPVGAYSGGEGNLWITKTSLFLPMIEREVFYEHGVMWDYTISEFEGEQVNQREVMRQKISQNFGNN